MSLRFKLCLLAWVAVVAVAACTNSVSGQDLAPIPVPDSIREFAPAIIPAPQQYTEIQPKAQPQPTSDEDWVMDIRPAAKVQPTSPVTINGNPVDAAAYARIFASIPFSRSAYNANPNYQHDSTMEILTGNARHQTIVRHTTTRTTQPRQVVPATVGNPYQYGYLRPALRLNYYRNFPSLNPYLNQGNLSGAF